MKKNRSSEPVPVPSAEDLDRAAEEQKAAEATATPSDAEVHESITNQVAELGKGGGAIVAPEGATEEHVEAANEVPATEPETPREFTDEEKLAIQHVEGRGYSHKAAIQIVDEYGAAKILDSKRQDAEEQMASETGVCKVLTPILKNKIRYAPGELIIVTRKEAEQLIACKSIRYLTEEDRTAADAARNQEK